MSASVTYSVSSAGGVVSGHEQESVLSAFCSVFGIKQDKAADYIHSQKLIKKDLTEAQAIVYRDKLTEIGIPVSLKKHGIEAADEFGGLSLTPTGDESIDETDNNASLGAIPAMAAAKNKSGFSCPKCQLAQIKTEQCSGCGIYVDKYVAAQAARQSSIVSGNNPDAAAIASVAKRNEADNLAREGEYTLGYLPVALALTFVSALIWYFIGVSINREMALVAIAIGGAIGYGARFAGSRGHVNGLICSGLLVLAITGGKFMLAGHFLESWYGDFSDVSSEYSEDAEVTAYFDELLVDSDGYAKINKSSGIAVKRFMMEHEFSDATSVVGVSEDDVEYFMMESAPMLEEVHANRADYTNGSDFLSAAMEEVEKNITRMSVFFSLWGYLDLLLLFFGASAAYKFGSGFKD